MSDMEVWIKVQVDDALYASDVWFAALEALAEAGIRVTGVHHTEGEAGA
jgi:hypothetical protein